MRMGCQEDFMVCTLCFTYNHSGFIKDTLRGFSIQKTSFPVVFIIVDDASKDGEQEVLTDWAERNLKHVEGEELWKDLPYARRAVASLSTNRLLQFVILLLKENHYQTGKDNLKYNYISKWMQKSKYQAICEGDDYWIASDKLERQVRFLENNQDYGLVYTNFKTYNQATGELKNGVEKPHDGYVTEALLCENFIATLTVCYRTSLLKLVDFSYKEKGFLMGDHPMWIELSLHSKIAHLPFISSVYRVLENSASHSSSTKETLLFTLNSISLKLYFIEKYGYVHLQKKLFQKYLFTEALLFALENKFFRAWLCYFKSKHFSLFYLKKLFTYINKENK